MPQLDVRDMALDHRPPAIRGVFEEMEPGETLTVINDRNPESLFFEMYAKFERFDSDGYELRKDGEERFVVTLPKQ